MSWYHKKNFTKYLSLLAGPFLFLLFVSLNLPFDVKIQQVIGISIWMILWWITESVPVPVTSLLPLILFPSLGIIKLDAVAHNYANPTVFLFLSGFIFALAMEKHNLHIRIALYIVKHIGTSSNRIVLGFMIATGFISMWISNTAAALLMLPIATSILSLLEPEFIKRGLEKDFRNFSVSLLISLTYSAVIGGMSTIIGSPVNAVLVGYMRKLYQMDISFADWFIVGFPFSVALIIVAYLVLVKIVFRVKTKSLPGISEIINEQISGLGKMSYQEYALSIIFILTATGWILREPLVNYLHFNYLNDTIIGLTGGLLLFLLPDSSSKSGFLLEWESMEKLPWGILLLIGGSLALAEALETTGVVRLIGNTMTSTGISNYWPVLIMVSAVTLFLTQFIGNTALNTMMLPIALGIANSSGVSPIIIGIAVTLSVSFSYTLPMSTAPNAVVFVGPVKIRDMLSAGIILSLIAYIFLLGLSRTISGII